MVLWSLYGIKSKKMLLHEFWFEYHQKWICLWRWHNSSFSRRRYSINNNRFSLGLLFPFEAIKEKVANKLNALKIIAP